MTIVKNLAFCNKNKLKNLNAFIESELDLSVFYPFPVDFLHSFLPLRLKFLNESFVSIENKKINGLVTVVKAGKKKIKFTRLLLEENSTEFGKFLINCVITLFISKGAESFYLIIDNKNTPLITMFKTGLGFNKLAVETIYKVDKDDIIIGHDEVNFEFIRKMKRGDVKKTVELINGAMNSYQKTAFYKEAGDFSENFMFPLEQFIISLGEKNNLIGYFSILKLNKSDYLLDFVLSKGFEGYYTEIIKFAKIKVSKRKGFKTLLIRIKSYYSNYGELNGMLEIEYKNSSENEILVKDFLIPKKQFSYERMIFNDITPAF